jgi:hypothetical protein
MTQGSLSAFKARFDPAQVAPDTFRSDSDVILFLHIPKTAGMSVGKTLQRAFDQFHPVAWENVGQSFRFRTRRALYERSCRNCRQVLMGHFSWTEIQYWRNQELPIQCATIIRDPLARFVSNYNYNCSDAHPANAQFRKRFPTMEDYAQQLPNDYQLYTMIGAFFDFDHALQMLTKYYSFIGLTEHLGTSLAHLQKSHGLAQPLEEHRENKAKILSKGEISAKVREIIENKSHNDQRLHDLVRDFYHGS